MAGSNNLNVSGHSESRNFRWLQEEEEWLENRIIADHGKPCSLGKHWVKTIVEDFQDQFPCQSREKPDGSAESRVEMITRWEQIPKRLNKWIKNHQKAILERLARGKPQNSMKRLAIKPDKRPRSKNAKDMAKAHDPDIRRMWGELCAQVKRKEITDSEKFKRYNEAISDLLKDDAANAKYTAMALQANLEKVCVGDGGGSEDGTASGTFAVFHPDTPVPEHHAGTDNMLVDESAEMPAAQAISHQTVTTPTSSYPSMSATSPPATSWEAPFQPFSAMVIDPHWYGINFGSSMGANQANEMAYENAYINLTPQLPQYEALPRLADTSQEIYLHLPSDHPSIDTSISIGNSDNTPRNLTTQQPHSQSSPYNPPPSSEVADNSRTDQSSLHRSIVPHISSSHDNHTASSNAVVAASRDGFKDWSPAGDWHLQKVFRGHTDEVYCLALSHNGKLLASGSSDCTIRVWNVETCGTVLGPLEGDTDDVFAVAFSPDDRRIVSVSVDCTVRIWDAQTGKRLHEPKEHRRCVISVAFSSDGSNVVSRDLDHETLIWDVYSGRRIRCLEKSDHYVYKVFFSADDKFVAGVNGDQLTIWDAKSGERVPTSLQAGSFGDFVWFGDSALYTCTNDGLCGWFQSGSLILHEGSAISPDRKWIATSCDTDKIYLYSRDPSPEELASVDDIDDEDRRFTFVEIPLDDDIDFQADSESE